MRICVHKATKRILEMQSDATLGTLILNAVNAGYLPEDIDEREVTSEEYESAKLDDPVEIAAKQTQQAKALEQEKKIQAILDNLPSWAAVQSSVQGISNLAEAKSVILKLSRIVYWLAKDQEN